MPYVIPGICPECGAPIFVYVALAITEDEVRAKEKEYPQIHYNCDCYKEKRGKKEASN